MLASKIRTAERILVWVTLLAVLVAAIVFIVLALSRPSHAAELVLGPPPQPQHAGTASVVVTLPKPTVRVLSRIVAAPAATVRRKPVTSVPVVAEPPLPVGSVQARIAAAWPGNDAWALRVVRCESNFSNNDRNSIGADGYWQFIPSTWHDTLGQSGWPSGYSLEYQTAQAWRLYQMAGPSQWDCS